MEGYVLHKRMQTYAVLDGNQLMLYETFDKKTQTPSGIRHVAHLRNAEISKLVNTRGVRHGLEVISESRVSTVLDLVDPNLCTQWYAACTKARTLHVDALQRDAVSAKCRTQLGLEGQDKLTKSTIARAYKRLSLKHHPDKVRAGFILPPCPGAEILSLPPPCLSIPLKHTQFETRPVPLAHSPLSPLLPRRAATRPSLPRSRRPTRRCWPSRRWWTSATAPSPSSSRQWWRSSK